MESWTVSTLVKGLPWWLVATGHSQRTKVMTSRAEGKGIRQRKHRRDTGLLHKIL